MWLDDPRPHIEEMFSNLVVFDNWAHDLRVVVREPECASTDRVRRWRKIRSLDSRAYDRERYQTNAETRRAAQRAYDRTPEARARRRARDERKKQK